MTANYYARFLLVTVALGLASGPAKTYANLVMTLSGNSGSSLVEVTFSGSSSAQRGGAIINYGWEFFPTDFDPFPAGVAGGDFVSFNFTLGSPTYSNLTRGLTAPITGVWLQDSSNSVKPGYERFGIRAQFEPIFDNTYIAGDLVAWSGSATMDLSAKGLTFDDFTPGTTGPIAGVNGIFEGQLVIVPEPTALTLCVLGMLGLLSRKRL
jgi:hypothetical protein